MASKYNGATGFMNGVPTLGAYYPREVYGPAPTPCLDVTVVGQEVMNRVCITMMSISNAEHPQEVAEEVVAAINTPPAEEGER